ncbi:hypothetical protein DPEC_G00088140 [Dallia pectoralis]|uniref:Uncharacterized protein n=1 Tax=Dallia pectoralis TaxID=75939 RepID=A0ACC2H0W1_DALPE|nr:hypothetical protein DPEC_G00088140 [Dallia pectoralis]
MMLLLGNIISSPALVIRFISSSPSPKDVQIMSQDLLIASLFSFTDLCVFSRSSNVRPNEAPTSSFDDITALAGRGNIKVYT